MKYLILLLTTLYATTLPVKKTTEISAIEGSIVILRDDIKKNIGGVIIREIGDRDYITGYIKGVGENRAKIVDKDYINGGRLANLTDVAMVGDRVVVGFLYDRVLIVAPNKESLRKVEYKLKVKSIDPTLFKSFLRGKKATSKEYKDFAKMVGIGLVAIVKGNKIYIYDPISQATIKTLDLE